jgi:hypothetical protein
MSRTYARLVGAGAAGVFIDPDHWYAHHCEQTRDDLDINALYLQRNCFVGSNLIGIPAEATGDVRLYDTYPAIDLDNSNSQLSGFTDANGATLIARVRYAIRVSNAAINITPKIKYGATETTVTTVASITGEAACSATSDAYSGANQNQVVLFTIPAGVKFFAPFVTIAGTPAVGYEVWARASVEVFIQSV